MIHADKSDYEKQQILIASLLVKKVLPQTALSVQLIETHISWVLIAGDYAYKIKKALNLEFLDFTELENRQFYCNEEIRLNSRLAPEIYLDVIPIGGSPASPEFNARPAIEYAVRMRRFPQENILAHLLEQDAVSASLIDNLAASLADFHNSLPPSMDAPVFGSPELVYSSITQNLEQLSASLLDPVDCKLATNLSDTTQLEFNRCKENLQVRRDLGCTRECHADLHLGNIVLIENHLVPFDGIEFKPALRWIDVMDEVAFLHMDLLHAQRPDLAFRFLNVYLAATGDYAGISVLRLYIAYRAEVRAKIYALRAMQLDNGADQNHSFATCHGYLALAEKCLIRHCPALIITHGLPGSGKTTYSQTALQCFQAIRIRSDVERKRLFGLNPLDNSAAIYAKEIYTADTSTRTYQHLLELAREILTAGYSVIVDAAFLKYDHRNQFKQLAQNMSAPFAIMSIKAATSKLKARIQLRKNKANDASDADIGVFDLLKETQDLLLPDELFRTVEFINESDGYDTTSDTLSWNQLDKLLKRTV